MDSILAHVRERQSELISFLKELVECESPTDDAAAVNRFVDLFATRVSDIAHIKTFPGGRYGKHVLCEFQSQVKASASLLALGHSDTVWPLGALRQMPWRQEKGRLWGPGVLDMKSGLAFFVFAMRALRDLDLPIRRKIALLIVSDEETGSHSSRALTEEQARNREAVFVLEPGTGLEGKLKTSRKGVGVYTLTIQGKPSHAGVDFAAGASAIDELAQQIEKIRTFTNLKSGVTVNVGIVSGGTRTNVVAARAQAQIDYRVPRLRDYESLRGKFERLAVRDKRCRLELEGELNRPPMERTQGIVRLFRTAKKLATDLGVSLEESSTGGGSDGNFTAGLGIPTLDGLGGVGEGAHAIHESILVDRIADRTALLAKLVQMERSA